MVAVPCDETALYTQPRSHLVGTGSHGRPVPASPCRRAHHPPQWLRIRLPPPGTGRRPDPPVPHPDRTRQRLYPGRARGLQLHRGLRRLRPPRRHRPRSSPAAARPRLSLTPAARANASTQAAPEDSNYIEVSAASVLRVDIVPDPPPPPPVPAAKAGAPHLASEMWVQKPGPAATPLTPPELPQR